MLKDRVKSVLLAGILLLALGTTARAQDVEYYHGDIWGGKTIDVGDIYAILHYNGTDPYNSILEIKYETEGGWMLEECHLWIDKVPPVERGSPGGYPYKKDTVNDDEFSFYITISELKTKFGIDWGSAVYVMPHCAVWLDADGDGKEDPDEQGETGFGGEINKPKEGSWFGYFSFTLYKPEEPLPNPYSGMTLTRGYWKRYWWTPTIQKPNPPQLWTEENKGNYLPVTLAGVEFNTPYDFWAQLDLPIRAKIFNQFLDQLIALYCNITRWGDLEGAVYNDPNLSGEPYEGWTVGEIFDQANLYNENTPRDQLEVLKTVMDKINNNEKYQVLEEP